MNVLVVSDQPMVSIIFEEAVHDAGLVPVGPASGAIQALSLADHRGPRAALVDASNADGNLGLLVAKLSARGVHVICVAPERSSRLIFDGSVQITTLRSFDRDGIVRALKSGPNAGLPTHSTDFGDFSGISAYAFP